MTVTIPFIRERFEHFNRLCFDGQLPMLPIRLSRAKRFCGAIRYRSRVNGCGERERSDFVLIISTRLEMSEVEVEDTILHEMIHYYIYLNKVEDTAPHGVVFRRMMNSINSRFGRHIAISHHSTAEQRDSDQLRQPHLVCISQLADGRTGVTVCARTRVFEIFRALPRRYQLKGMRWFYTTDPYFNRFPRCNTAKIFLPAEEDCMEHLESAVELVCDGKVMRRK